jgi:DNA-binding beta-propeller fold protein YncE
MAARSDQSVFLAEPCTGRIMHIGPDGQLLREWGERGTGDTQYNLIRDLTLAPDEQSLFVVDEGNHRVTQVRLDGQLLQQWSSGEWGVQAPLGLAVDHAGTFYLLDGATQQVVIRPLSGQLQRWSLPNPADGVNTIAIDAARGWIHVGGADNILYLFDTGGTFLGGQYVSGSTGTLVETDPAGRVYASTGYHEIYLFAPEDEPE